MGSSKGMNETLQYGSRHIPGTLVPGRTDISHFRLLASVSMIRKKNILNALEDVLIRGVSRREACERHGVSQSHFSVKFKLLQMVSQNVVRMYPYIAAETLKEEI